MVEVGGRDEEPMRTVTLASRRRRRWPVLVWVLVAIVVIIPLGAAVASRDAYGTFAFWGTPQRIDYCGRRYYEAGSEPGNPAKFTSEYENGTASWQRVSRTFWGKSIYAAVLPVKGSEPCSMVLYIPAGSSQWEVYPLSGGP